MGRDDWFRQTSWGPREKEAFYRRLERSRSDAKKAQYLRIQALHLHGTGKAELAAAALELLEDLLARFPEEFQLAMVHSQRAACLDALGRPLEAIEAFRSSVAAQRAFPNLRTRVAYEFGMFCVRRNLASLYDEASSYLDDDADDPVFPADHFEANAIRAIIAAHRRDTSAAQAFAAEALAAAAQERSGLSHHPDLGLVGPRHHELLARLKELATDTG